MTITSPRPPYPCAASLRHRSRGRGPLGNNRPPSPKASDSSGSSTRDGSLSQRSPAQRRCERRQSGSDRQFGFRAHMAAIAAKRPYVCRKRATTSSLEPTLKPRLRLRSDSGRQGLCAERSFCATLRTFITPRYRVNCPSILDAGAFCRGFRPLGNTDASAKILCSCSFKWGATTQQFARRMTFGRHHAPTRCMNARRGERIQMANACIKKPHGRVWTL